MSWSDIFKDPESGGVSASRVASVCFVLIDTLWVVAAIKGWPPAAAYAPVSAFLGVCTGASFGAYGVNSFGRVWNTAKRGPLLKPEGEP